MTASCDDQRFMGRSSAATADGLSDTHDVVIEYVIPTGGDGDGIFSHVWENSYSDGLRTINELEQYMSDLAQ